LIAIIPARAGSVRYPDKNFLRFGGSSLVDRAVEQAIAVGLPAYVATDRPGYTNAKARGVFNNPHRHLFGEHANIWLTVEYVCYQLGHFDSIVLLQPTSSFWIRSRVRRKAKKRWLPLEMAE